MSVKSGIVILLAVYVCAAGAAAADFGGRVLSKDTGQPIVGVTLKIRGTGQTAFSDPAGNYRFPSFPAGEQTVIASLDGYEVAYKKINVADGAAVNFILEPKVFEGEEVIVTATRAAKNQTPVAFSNLTRPAIDERYWAQDIPMLLGETPNLYAYSDAGNGMGYSYLKIRGFEQKRVAVMLNGIPLNDAESGEVCWIDLPDFAASVEDIQVQRGVGNSLYGASALGGSVNLLTSDFSAIPKIKAETGYGSFNGRKLMFSGNSGLIKDSYVIYGRFSKIKTDGYRENSWSEMWGYFLGMARYGENSTLKINLYGGPEESHLAYKGITAEQLISDRKFNELTWDGEIDHFNQPHYELLHDINLGEKYNLANTIYYFDGDGYYDQLRSGRYLEEYNLGDIWVGSSDQFPFDYYAQIDDSTGLPLPDSTTGLYRLQKTDLIRQRSVKEYDWGWIPRLTCDLGRGKLIAGGELRIHDAHHLGKVIWAAAYPGDLPPMVRYYDYTGKRQSYATFIHSDYHLTGGLSAMLDFQYQHLRYELSDDKRFKVSLERDYDFVSPRFGLNYELAPGAAVFVNVSTAERIPALKDIYDPTDYWSNPYYKPANFVGDANDFSFVGKELKPERLLDLELGGTCRTGFESYKLDLGLNLYRMQMTDEIIPYAGQIDDDGYPISGNAPRTIHQGVEFSAALLTKSKLKLSGNLALNSDRFDEYIEYGFDYDAWQAIPYDRSGNRIGGFPNIIANYSIGYKFNPVSLACSGRFIGEQYLDNSEDSAKKLGSYNVLDLSTSLNLTDWTRYQMTLNIRINNLLDRDFPTAGYIEPEDGLPRYIVGAKRNYFVLLSLEL